MSYYNDYTLQELKCHISKEEWNTIILEADYEADEEYDYELDVCPLLPTNVNHPVP